MPIIHPQFRYTNVDFAKSIQLCLSLSLSLCIRCSLISRLTDLVSMAVSVLLYIPTVVAIHDRHSRADCTKYILIKLILTVTTEQQLF